MAEGREEKSKEDLTEEASPHRIEEYRQKGIVAQSKELTGLMALLATAITTYVVSPQWVIQMMDFMRQVFRTDLSARVDLGAPHIAHQYLMKAFEISIALGLPICGAGFILGVLGSVLQIGAIFSMDPIAPDFNKINPIQGFTRLLSMKQFFDGIRLVIKIAIVLVLSYLLIKSEILIAPSYLGGAPGYLLQTYGKTAKTIFFSMMGVLFVFSMVDLGMQKFEYSKNLRMTKQEAKQEHKEREGDPQIKARIRSIQRELARRRMMQAVKKADVIVTNPTHIAVAIVYDKSTMNAPKVVAKGADFVAQKIKKIAMEAGVPLVENVPLARTLYKSVKIGQGVPRALYQAVAEVLAYVYRLRKRDL